MAVFFCSAVIVLYGVSAAFYGKVVARDEAYRELSVFIEALSKINSDYVEPPDLQKVQEGALRGLIEALDPYSTFLSKDQTDALLRREASGEDAGPGLILSKRSDLICVVSLTPNGSAREAGLRAGDYIIAVDGTGVEDKGIVEVENMLKGTEGSRAKVSVFRSARTKPVEIEFTRKRDVEAAVTARILDGNIGLLEVPSLARTSMDQVRVKLKTLISAGADKLILDLRGCADGTWDQGRELANLFLRDGVVYYSKNRQGEMVGEARAEPEKALTDLPLVVLINGASAGPAEIVAGALKDRKRATLVGEKSFGVGSSQTRIRLKNGSMLILSTTKVYTPGGKMIQDETLRSTGIRPDIMAPSDDRQQDLLVESYYDEKDDEAKYRKLQEAIRKEQLEKAIEHLVSGSARKAA